MVVSPQTMPPVRRGRNTSSVRDVASIKASSLTANEAKSKWSTIDATSFGAEKRRHGRGQPEAILSA